MKRGFTLVELIAVIIILAAIGLITFPVVTGIINDSHERAYKEQVSLIEDASRKWGIDNQDKLSMEQSIKVSVDTLINEGYISNENGPVLKDPRDESKNMDGCVEITYVKAYNQYEYRYSEVCSYSNVKYVDNSGANSPELFNNMIPIVYRDGYFRYADLNDRWYDYNNKEWANAVVLNNGIKKNVGDIITNDDIALWYVWIPRYKYQLFNVDNGSVNEQLINVTFEKNTETTGTVTCADIDFVANPTSEVSETCTNAVNGNWYTHPAFTFGDQQLKGFWMGKFEVSTTDEACSTTSSSANCNKVSTVTIKPSVNSWRYATISNYFTSIQNISGTYNINNTDSHMIKNMEWGAVAYLKQSKYGLGTTDIGINNHNNGIIDRKTGCGATSESSYSAGCSPYNTVDGMLASTTGNIYGVYDMSGGTPEYVMSNMVDENGNFYPRLSGFASTIDTKYYDKYAYGTTQLTHGRGKLGDATKETLKTFGSGTGGWYNDHSAFQYSTNSWLRRGGLYSNKLNSGVFNFYYGTGNYVATFSTRAILISK